EDRQDRRHSQLRQFRIVLQANYHRAALSREGPPFQGSGAHRRLLWRWNAVEDRRRSVQAGIHEATVDCLGKIIATKASSFFLQKFWPIDRIADRRWYFDPLGIEEKVGLSFGNQPNRTQFFRGDQASDNAQGTNSISRHLG